ncbi:16S rRNA (cytosine(1402)-N(4))-methyltransferase RsmH [Desulfuromonas acetoxidans]|uniref:Ribosomal RNA small subunit methyltransferase H n=1 Tax=Desulfuromonas acetoxidans (strain DSM 684 / 11070) TaxID=281689 RepID=Q1JXA6_DESA6|nr:16S rRNA (cytosine(1402)-N(4))-methyltransferase RsmH [Desulfuromonas acetoxidans]EAT14886.1 methyltransferase [Desulfuromonas acetoxidans DSM 684]MBF0646854.1 16S rRNA (cytosine(1402)-N(4))-methyltransferase RsmH [Desulfuromonas acetoxidans]NVD23346.1 16S rRNA (cytosine(1402)-N(4))-methyltransferase RsmH [Desulfuromonas acetoxidans]NVE15413.1 16S rRNA (cytosine(1402)-N(4))-methyltransferase RsmH [Desulfuromonas acetoxidans]
MADNDFVHQSVLPTETLELLDLHAGDTVLDGTLGGAGHSRLILEATAPNGVLIGLDRDHDALANGAEVLAAYGDRVILRHANFADANQVVEELGLDGLNGMLLDLGVSSYQLDQAERGFSFRADAPLDMRMDQQGDETAADVVNTATVEELTLIFKKYGEERWAGRIARRIERIRQQTPITTTFQLAELVKETVPGGRVPARIHPATRVFQALRIRVNDELDSVAKGVEQGIGLLKPGGVLAVISFHSLEDRIVKNIFRHRASPCVCPPRLPMCACGKKADVEVLTRRGVRASETEIAENPRSRSAVLRAVRRLDVTG